MFSSVKWHTRTHLQNVYEIWNLAFMCPSMAVCACFFSSQNSKQLKTDWVIQGFLGNNHQIGLCSLISFCILALFVVPSSFRVVEMNYNAEFWADKYLKRIFECCVWVHKNVVLSLNEFMITMTSSGVFIFGIFFLNTIHYYVYIGRHFFPQFYDIKLKWKTPIES